MKHAKNFAGSLSRIGRSCSQEFPCGQQPQGGDPAKAAAFLYNIIESGNLPKRILIGKKYCADVKAYLEERISEIDSYLAESSRTDFDE